MNVITAVSPRASPILSPVDESQLRSILEFDDDDQHAFSRDIFTKYFAQVNETVAVMNALLAQRRLRELAQAAHFLKGSSSNIGVLSIRLTCEEIQHAAEANVSFVEEQNRQAAHLNELLIKLPIELAELQRHLSTMYGTVSYQLA